MNILQLLKVLRKTFLTPIKSRQSYSQCAEDLIVDQFFRGLNKSDRSKFYVDVGSHHPKRGSNTYRLYKSGWRGILIDMEDDKVLSSKLARPRDTVIKAAVSNKIEEVAIYSPGTFSTNATVSVELSQSDESYKKTDTINTQRLDVILEENNCPYNFDFLSIDIEGNDYKALQGLSLGRFMPSLICGENYESQKGVKYLLKSKIHNYLLTNSYDLIGWSGPSTFYSKQTSLNITK